VAMTTAEKLDQIAAAIIALDSKVEQLTDQIKGMRADFEDRLDTVRDGVDALIEHEIVILEPRSKGVFRQLVAEFRTAFAFRK
jgi:hypothetical protein